MSTSRAFKYNPSGTPIAGTLQVGSVSVALGNIDFSGGGWWNGADEELGYVICKPVPLDNQDTPVPGDNLFLSTTYKAIDIALSNNNQTATQIFSYQQSVLGETFISEGDKVMFSVKFTSTNPSVGVGGRFIGIGLTAMGYSGPFADGYPGGGDELSIGLSDFGQLYFSTGVDMTAPQILSGTSLPTWSDGDVIDVAIDYDLSQLWIRVNGGLWNNYIGSNPESSSVGVDISSFTAANSSAPGYYPVLCPYIYGSMEILNIPKYGCPSGYNFLGNTTASVGFLRSSDLTDNSFIELVNSYFNQNFLTAILCKNWLTANGYWTSWGNLPAGMVLYLDAGLSESYPGSGSTWYDLSGNGNHGTINGATYSSSQGGILGFDGVNDYISFASTNNIPIGNDNYTISIWFNTSSSNTTGGFFGWGNYGTTNEVNAFRLLANGQGFVNYWWANDQNFFATVSPNTWYNVIAKFDGTNREIWLNGTLVGSQASSGHNVPFSNNLTIGLTAPFLNEYFPGKIGQVVFYRRGATDQEIQSIYNSGLERFV